MGNLPVALALCLLPFLLGWLAARAYYKVSDLHASVASLTATNGTLTNELTEMRVKHTQLEAEIESKGQQLRKAKDDLMMAESERNALREQLAGGGKPTTITFAGTKYKSNDLKIVEGIGPKIADLLIKAGIDTWKKLSATTPEKIREILEAAGPQFNIHDPSTWPAQAGLADNSNWDALKKLQDDLTGGKV